MSISAIKVSIWSSMSFDETSEALDGQAVEHTDAELEPQHFAVSGPEHLAIAFSQRLAVP